MKKENWLCFKNGVEIYSHSFSRNIKMTGLNLCIGYGDVSILIRVRYILLTLKSVPSLDQYEDVDNQPTNIHFIRLQITASTKVKLQALKFMKFVTR